MANQNYQKSVLSMLLAAPSFLHMQWRDSNDENVWTAELNRLEFSAQARESALATMRTHKPSIDAFKSTALLLMNEPWSGGEPHPEPPTDRDLVREARRLDGE
jgi:hypothetical protein